MYGQDKLNRTLRVNGQGEIIMPLVGAVKVAGLTTQEIEKRLSELYDAHFLVNPQITVEVKEFRHQRVAVTGAVNETRLLRNHRPPHPAGGLINGRRYCEPGSTNRWRGPSR